MWWHRMPGESGWVMTQPNVLPDLAAAIAHQPTMKVLLGNGVYDLCTPFFQTEYDIDHLSAIDERPAAVVPSISL